MPRQSIFDMKLNKVYPLLIQKAERKGRTRQEVDEVTCWLLGYDEEGLQKQLNDDVTYGAFFDDAPHFNPAARRITGTICGIRVEEIEDEAMWKVRCLDKLVDELAKGKPMSRILRSGDEA